jgi:hypothetical protein
VPAGCLLGLAMACGDSEFRCRESSECGTADMPGFCEINGYCSFTDPGCESGRRYGELSGDLAYTCVTEAPNPEGTSEDDGAADAPTGGVASSEGSDDPVATSSPSDGDDSTTAEAGSDDATGSSTTGPPASSEESSGPRTSVLSFGERTGADVTGVTRDNYLNSDAPTDNNGSHGDFHVREDGGVVGVLRFDVAALPAEAEVVAVELRLFHLGGGGAGEVQIFRLTEDWTEGENNAGAGISNWTERTPRAAWSTPGAGTDSAGPEMVGGFFSDTEFVDYAIELPPDLIEGWRDDPSNNFGIVFRPGNLTGLIGFGSREADPSQCPLLVVTYES